MFPLNMSFAHISYTLFQIQMSSGKMLHKRNFTCTKTLKKIEGTLTLTHGNEQISLMRTL